MNRTLNIILIFLSLFPLTVYSANKCLHISSYHKGYAWTDGISQGVEEVLLGKCELKTFYMDTKRNVSSSFALKKSHQVRKLIASYKPDVVIASDDNAAKYVVTQYKNSKIPFVFTGVNWTAKAYGFPYKNVTGMVEVAPILPLLRVIKKSNKKVRRGIYISADVISEHKDYVQYKKVYAKKGVVLSSIFVKTMKQWVQAYVKAQSADFIILNNNAGINDWDKATAIKTVTSKSKKLTVTIYRWMMPYTMFGITKNAEEQGRWAAQVALEILSGTSVSDIPISINKEWNMFVNNKLILKSKVRLDPGIRKRASVEW